MRLSPSDFENGITMYWEEIESRSPEVQARERYFPEFSKIFGARVPPHFTRSDLEAILIWKYTDGRRRARALEGLGRLSDTWIRDFTRATEGVRSASEAAGLLRGKSMELVSQAYPPFSPPRTRSCSSSETCCADCDLPVLRRRVAVIGAAGREGKLLRGREQLRGIHSILPRSRGGTALRNR